VIIHGATLILKLESRKKQKRMKRKENNKPNAKFHPGALNNNF
jgi:hypothetical protein